MKDKVTDEVKEEAGDTVEEKKAKQVIQDLNGLSDRLGKLTRRFSNTAEQANAVSSTLRLLTGMRQLMRNLEASPDIPVQFSFRATFGVCEHQIVDATISGLLLPLSMIAEDVLAPIAAAGINGLEAMREEIEEVEEVVTDANVTYDAYTRSPSPKDLN